jgi:lipoprotein-releasing system ATP-binding protein
LVWQRHHLLPDFTAAENVAMPLLVRGVALGQALQTAGEWLAEVGLASRTEQRAGELSGGEQQRVAIARALVNRPKILLADEPTGNLDSATGEAILTLLQEQTKYGMTIVMVTHERALAEKFADRLAIMGDGKLLSTSAAKGLAQ